MTDADVTIHRYLSEVDGLGTRIVQGIMELEIKTRGGKPTDSQLDTLRKKHATTFTNRCIEIDGNAVRNFGVSVLSLGGTTPDDSKTMLWGRFNGHSCKMDYRPIDKKHLVSLLRFELHPDNFTPRPFRRHHKTQQVLVQEKTPLGFWIDRELEIKS